MNYRLPKEFTEKWLEALRSGDYDQTTSTLFDGTNGFCCLGVACVVAGHSKKKLIGHAWPGRAFKKPRVPKEISQFKMDGLIDELSNMNDHNGYNFNEISDWIEKNVELY